MMYGYGSMIGSGGGTLGFLALFVVLVDLVLIGVWLWQHIEKK